MEGKFKGPRAVPGKAEPRWHATVRSVARGRRFRLRARQGASPAHRWTDMRQEADSSLQTMLFLTKTIIFNFLFGNNFKLTNREKNE